MFWKQHTFWKKKEKQRLLFSIHQHWKYGMHSSCITNGPFKLPRFCFKGLSRNTCFLLLICVGFNLISYLYFYIFYLSCFYESFYISSDNSTDVNFFKNNRQNGFIFQLSIAPLHWQKKRNAQFYLPPRLRHQCNLFTACLDIKFSSNFAKEPEEVTLYLAFVSHARTFPRHEDDGRVCVDVCNLLAVVVRLHLLFWFCQHYLYSLLSIRTWRYLIFNSMLLLQSAHYLSCYESRFIPSIQFRTTTLYTSIIYMD